MGKKFLVTKELLHFKLLRRWRLSQKEICSHCGWEGISIAKQLQKQKKKKERKKEKQFSMEKEKNN